MKRNCSFSCVVFIVLVITQYGTVRPEKKGASDSFLDLSFENVSKSSSYQTRPHRSYCHSKKELDSLFLVQLMEGFSACLVSSFLLLPLPCRLASHLRSCPSLCFQMLNSLFIGLGLMRDKLRSLYSMRRAVLIQLLGLYFLVDHPSRRSWVVLYTKVDWTRQDHGLMRPCSLKADMDWLNLALAAMLF